MCVTCSIDAKSSPSSPCVNPAEIEQACAAYHETFKFHISANKVHSNVLPNLRLQRQEHATRRLGTHLRVPLEDRDTIDELSKDASDAPDVHRRGIDCASQQNLWRSVQQRDHLHAIRSGGTTKEQAKCVLQLENFIVLHFTREVAHSLAQNCSCSAPAAQLQCAMAADSLQR